MTRLLVPVYRLNEGLVCYMCTCKCTPNLMADGLTLQECLMPLPATLYVRGKHTGCVVSEFSLTSSPVYMYTIMSFMCGNVVELCRIHNLCECKHSVVVCVCVCGGGEGEHGMQIPK